MTPEERSNDRAIGALEAGMAGIQREIRDALGGAQREIQQIGTSLLQLLDQHTQSNDGRFRSLDSAWTTVRSDLRGEIKSAEERLDERIQNLVTAIEGLTPQVAENTAFRRAAQARKNALLTPLRELLTVPRLIGAGLAAALTADVLSRVFS
jgi:hypothetical protein